MSYTFNARAATKALAIQAALARFDEIAAQDPTQAPARKAVEASVKAVVRQLADDESLDVHVTVTGYVMGQAGEGGKVRVTNAKTSASALLAVRS
jgi:hypothetical protein